jgi:hypothetical protein
MRALQACAVEYGGRRLPYASAAEMTAALADFERRIAARVNQVRISSSKGT